MKIYLSLILLGLNLFIYGQDTLEFTDLYGDYIGQTPPGDTPVVFAQGIISTDLLEHCAPAFSPDNNEVFWWVNRPPSNDKEKWTSWGMTMKRIENKWTVPQVSDLFYGTPVFTTDGKKAYYSDNVPLKDSVKRNPMNKDIWVVEKIGNVWSDPKCLNLVASYPEIRWAGFPTQISIADNGTLYFIGYMQGTQNDFGIYRSKLINGEFAKPELLPVSINMSPYLNWTPFIAPDESYLIFSSNRVGEFGNGDLYISFHDTIADTWFEPLNMGEPVNSNQQERLPGISSDGKYLFFTRYNPPHNQDIFWVSSKVIDKLKEKYFEK